MPEIRWDNINTSGINSALGQVNAARNDQIRNLNNATNTGIAALNLIDKREQAVFDANRADNTAAVQNQMAQIQNAEQLAAFQQANGGDVNRLRRIYGNQIDQSKVNQALSRLPTDVQQRALSNDRLKDFNTEQQAGIRQAQGYFANGDFRKGNKVLAGLNISNEAYAKLIDQSGRSRNQERNFSYKAFKDGLDRDTRIATDITKTNINTRNKAAELNSKSVNAFNRGLTGFQSKFNKLNTDYQDNENLINERIRQQGANVTAQFPELATPEQIHQKMMETDSYYAGLVGKRDGFNKQLNTINSERNAYISNYQKQGQTSVASGANPEITGNLAGVLDVVAIKEAGDADYGAWNAGTKGTGGSILHSSTNRGAQDLSKVTVSEWRQRAALSGKNPKRLRHVGRYQVSSDHIDDMVKAGILKEDSVLDSATQDQMAMYLLGKNKHVNGYIKGQHQNPNKVQYGLSQIFASVPVPKGRKTQSGAISDGSHVYFDVDSHSRKANGVKVKGAKAHTRKLLDAMRNAYENGGVTQLNRATAQEIANEDADSFIPFRPSKTRDLDNRATQPTAEQANQAAQQRTNQNRQSNQQAIDAFNTVSNNNISNAAYGSPEELANYFGFANTLQGRYTPEVIANSYDSISQSQPAQNGNTGANYQPFNLSGTASQSTAQRTALSTKTSASNDNVAVNPQTKATGKAYVKASTPIQKHKTADRYYNAWTKSTRPNANIFGSNNVRKLNKLGIQTENGGRTMKVTKENGSKFIKFLTDPNDQSIKNIQKYFNVSNVRDSGEFAKAYGRLNTNQQAIAGQYLVNSLQSGNFGNLSNKALNSNFTVNKKTPNLSVATAKIAVQQQLNGLSQNAKRTVDEIFAGKNGQNKIDSYISSTQNDELASEINVDVNKFGLKDGKVFKRNLSAAIKNTDVIIKNRFNTSTSKFNESLYNTDTNKVNETNVNNYLKKLGYEDNVIRSLRRNVVKAIESTQSPDVVFSVLANETNSGNKKEPVRNRANAIDASLGLQAINKGNIDAYRTKVRQTARNNANSKAGTYSYVLNRIAEMDKNGQDLVDTDKVLANIMADSSNTQGNFIADSSEFKQFNSNALANYTSKKTANFRNEMKKLKDSSKYKLSIRDGGRTEPKPVTLNIRQSDILSIRYGLHHPALKKQAKKDLAELEKALKLDRVTLNIIK